MKRATIFILALFCLMVSGVWAQGVNYTTDDIGKLMGSDSKVYATAADVPWGVTVSGMIAYVNTTDKRGLVIGPTDLNHNSTEGSGKSTISQALVSCDNYKRARPAVATTSWGLPNQYEFNCMIGENGCQSADNLRQLKGRQAKSCASDAAGIWAMQTDEGYWSCTETSTSGNWYNFWADDCNSVGYKEDLKYVRPCFRFSFDYTTYIDHTVSGEGTNTVVTPVERTVAMGGHNPIDGTTVIDGYGMTGYLNPSNGNVEVSNKTVVINTSLYFTNPVVISGTVNFILCDGVTFTCTKMINVASGHTLNIYCQSEGTGKLVVTGTDGNAGIGSIKNVYAGTINIHGGTIEATGGEHGAGIGGGRYRGFDPAYTYGHLTVYGGDVTAKGGDYGAGIGSGDELDSSDGFSGYVTIYGGNVKATGGLYSAGIGGGCYGGGTFLYIYGGTVKAWGSGYFAPGIGTGYHGSGGTVTVYGGDVESNATKYGYGVRCNSAAFYGGTFKASASSPSFNAFVVGQLTIGDPMTVWAGWGNMGKGGRYPKDERVNACLSNQKAVISVCDHPNAAYTVNGTAANGDHTRHCRYCNVTATEPHNLVDGICTACGATNRPTHTVTIYLPKDKTNTGVYEVKQTYQVIDNKPFNLPGSPVEVSKMEFDGWLVGTATNGSYLKADGETLLSEGDAYTVTEDVSLTARYKPLNVNLYDEDDNKNAYALFKYYNKPVASVTLQGRTLFKDGDWNTLCLPFDVTLSNSPLSGDGVQVMELDAAATHFDATNLLTVHFEPISGDVLKAGRPYIIKWDNTDENIESPVFKDVKMSSVFTSTVAFNGGTFTGNFVPLEINADNINEIVYLGAGNTLGYADEPRTLRSFRAHFEVPSVNGARAMTRSIIYFGNETTGISEKGIVNSEKFAPTTGWYSLDGRKLSGEPTQKGVYIHNGRKVIVK